MLVILFFTGEQILESLINKHYDIVLKFARLSGLLKDPEKVIDDARRDFSCKSKITDNLIENPIDLAEFCYGICFKKILLNLASNLQVAKVKFPFSLL